MAIEEFRISYPCPVCKESFPISLYQMIEGGVVFCPKCQATNAEVEMQELERILNTLGRSIKNFRKCLNEKAQTENL